MRRQLLASSEELIALIIPPGHMNLFLSLTFNTLRGFHERIINILTKAGYNVTDKIFGCGQI